MYSFGKTGTHSKTPARLTRPEFGYLFAPPPADEWVCLDLEMTGLNPKTDHILSLGAVKISRTHGTFSIDTANALSIICKPPIMPATDTIVIHGLRPMDVADGVSYDEMLAQLLPFLGARPIVGFYTQMDLAFLNALAKPFLGAALPNAAIDVSLLDQKLRKQQNRNPDAPIDRRHLHEMLKTERIPALPAHDSLNDALMTAMLFCQLQHELQAS
ncbi:DNA polymerase III subunit epsilon [Moraxella caviae]|uniref:DNA polymerase III subunit epsilon n=1 Tax=Moraxella caviae TaxID=34060 RepID=A0A1T0A587_9GAMM|nr:DNA polymerase III subunit epsilon [Moraxella caviae]